MAKGLWIYFVVLVTVVNANTFFDKSYMPFEKNIEDKHKTNEHKHHSHEPHETSSGHHEKIEKAYALAETENFEDECNEKGDIKKKTGEYSHAAAGVEKEVKDCKDVDGKKKDHKSKDIAESEATHYDDGKTKVDEASASVVHEDKKSGHGHTDKEIAEAEAYTETVKDGDKTKTESVAVAKTETISDKDHKDKHSKGKKSHHKKHKKHSSEESCESDESCSDEHDKGKKKHHQSCEDSCSSEKDSNESKCD